MALFGDKTLPRGTTPEPSAKIREACNRITVSLGGRVYAQASHADRVLVVDKGESTERRVELAECGHVGTLIDLPDPGNPEKRVRLCTVCDAVPRMPRILAKAKEVVGP